MGVPGRSQARNRSLDHLPHLRPARSFSPGVVLRLSRVLDTRGCPFPPTLVFRCSRALHPILCASTPFEPSARVTGHQTGWLTSLTVAPVAAAPSLGRVPPA